MCHFLLSCVLLGSTALSVLSATDVPATRPDNTEHREQLRDYLRDHPEARARARAWLQQHPEAREKLKERLRQHAEQHPPASERLRERR